MAEKTSRTRRRGVRASRAKLNRALLDAGLGTQSALASHIADIEGLETVPRDLVNRVFRERAVESRSLERVARALGVEAYSLYLSAADLPRGEFVGHNAVVASRSKATRRARMSVVLGALGFKSALAAGILLLLTGVSTLMLSSSTPLGCGLGELLDPVRAAPNKLGVVIARFAQDPGNRAQRFLATQLIDDPSLDPYMSVLKACFVLSLDTPRDMSLRRRALRKRGRQTLRAVDGLVLLWGRVEGNRVYVRFISRPRNVGAVKIFVRGRLAEAGEARLRVPVSLDAPADASVVKKASLDLMRPRSAARVRLRARAIKAYAAVVD